MLVTLVIVGLVAVIAIKEAGLIVASIVAFSILEDVPTVFTCGQSDIAMLPWVESGPAITSIKVASVSVAFLITSVVPLLLAALVHDAFLKLCRILAVSKDFNGAISSSRRCLVIDLTVLASPLSIAGTLIAGC